MVLCSSLEATHDHSINPGSMELTDHQIKLLKIVDAFRWGETERLSVYNYHLIRRALGTGDPVITMEMEQAAHFVGAHNFKPPSSPEPGPKRSPWMNTWDVPFWRVEAVELEEPDLDRMVEELEAREL